MIDGFTDESVPVSDVRLHVSKGGGGPPLVLLHGFPQTHLMWKPVAAALAERFTIYAFDLPGYGASSVAGGGAERFAKRRVAQDIVAAMDTFGVERFAIAGHDRGGRVAYRLALDMPERVKALAVLDIVPTGAVWDAFTVARAMSYSHWTFLAQPAPLPEMLISGNAEAFLRFKMASWTKTKDLSAFDPAAVGAYVNAYRQPGTIKASCDDYRAGATIDWEHDRQTRTAGERIEAPVLAVWGAHFSAGGGQNPLEIWRSWARSVEGGPIDAGHFVVEENPQETRDALLPFMERHAG